MLGASSFAVRPTRTMPMPTKIGCWSGQHDEVADPGFDHLVATGA